MPIELIGSDADLAAWLGQQGLPTEHLDDCLPALHAVREHARAAVEALATGQAAASADLAALNAALQALRGHVALVDADGPHPQLAFQLEQDDGAAETAFRIALSFANFLESGERHRLKLCANPGCGFAFLDTSTNGTRRWCYMRFCGNRIKARAFRQRRTERRQAPGGERGGPDL